MNGKKPKWMNEEAHKTMMDVPNTNQEFMARSEKNKKNRRGGSLSNEIEPSHFQGSISASQHAKKMAKAKEGVLPHAGEVFLSTHFKEVPGKGTERFKKRMDESSSQGVACDPNQVYFEAAGGRNRGYVKGLGQNDHLYYGTPARHGASQSYTPSIVSQLQTQFEERV
ncbi:uncharacterized protein LOC110706519 [Chenopodium quinoa]|uniref:uncharacterized protein LOC110706519 n=1 Tax=Chenopodium quinoa TaxID=63459 RepID=UPI000B782420|nr:uncharacterized protein LOC110706519 [Chenopodium quinoa]